MDKQSTIGVVGTIFSFSLGQWSDIAGICAALATIIYMGMGIVQRLRNGK